MQEFILMVLEKYSYFGVFFLILFENVFPPIPSEVILLLSGFMTTYTSLSLILMVIFASLGSVCGAIILYYIGNILNKERLKKIVRGKVGKLLFLKEKDIDKADKWFDEKGNISVFFCRFIPLVRSLISVPAGMSDMPKLKFLTYTFFGSLIWNSILIFLGYTLSDNWRIVLDILDKYKIVAVIILGVLSIYFVYKFYKKRVNK